LRGGGERLRKKDAGGEGEKKLLGRKMGRPGGHQEKKSRDRPSERDAKNQGGVWEGGNDLVRKGAGSGMQL